MPNLKTSKIEKIAKRDGRVVPFDASKIYIAVTKALAAVGDNDLSKAERVANDVIGILEITCRQGRVPDVEEVQDLVEKMLIQNGYADAAKSYILYREQRARIRDGKKLLAGAVSMVDEYLRESDWRVKENSNMTYSLQGLNVYLSSDVLAYYWLTRVYNEKIRESHLSGDFHLHDLGVLGPYCCGWDLKDLIIRGFAGVAGKIESRPAKHLRSALGQIVNFFFTLQGEAAGAQAFSNFDTLMAPFVKNDNLTYKDVRQAIQEFVFNLNVPTRVGFQTPFTNLSFDLTPPNYLKDEAAIVGGTPQDYTYGDCQQEIDMINRAFCEIMNEGDSKGRIFSFPIPTYNISTGFNPDNPNLDALWQMTAKYGIPYFANFLNSDLKPEDARSMCCRLRLDLREIRRRGGGLFGSDPLTGSLGVVTINMPRIGYLSKTKEDFFSRLRTNMEIARDSLEIKRKALDKLAEKGLFPYSICYLQSIKDRLGSYWANHFSTIGLIGMNEAILNFMGTDITTSSGSAFAKEVLNYMKAILAEFQETTGNLYNLESTPGEGATYRLAKLDRERFSRIISAGEKEPYYTNSSQLPVDADIDLVDAMKHQDELQTIYTGGTVFHCFMGERIHDPEMAKQMVMKTARNFRLPYFTLTPTFSICPNHGYLNGENPKCPTCNHETEVYSRVVGYFRPVRQWNKGKQEEFSERHLFSENMLESIAA
ncbi:MAG: ribonucleoside triphosphate reductase [Dehalococcoidales bacterium]|jgi:ribonucleoside-triphosphate reductase|nr:ribonucleoside triphosphate reductase [Dehalococcoidales bacterium]MDX9985937.1 ribonucleoside triphosphate reductase [Dehalococcoidales bacterium]